MTSPLAQGNGLDQLPGHADVVVVGGGPGGLSCARDLAAAGARVLLVERKKAFGQKVCAGGITCNGLLPLLPPELIEGAFPEQHVFSPRQRIRIHAPEPIIATISRRRLGRWMAQQAQAAGAMLHGGVQALALTRGGIVLRDGSGRVQELRCGHVVGADGARSLVRRALGLPSRLAFGLNAMLPLRWPQMEWHLNPRLFTSGYAWIFPHAAASSVGAFGNTELLSARTLQHNLQRWAQGRGLPLDARDVRAGWVNYEYQGLCFGTRWLVGDAAGLSSALTGEGIYPAVRSGQAVAAMLLSGRTQAPELEPLIAQQRRHRRLAQLAGRGRIRAELLAESLIFCLRLGVLDFRRLEMAQREARCPPKKA